MILLVATSAAAMFGCDPMYEVCVNVKRCGAGNALVGVHVVFRCGDAIIGAEGYTDPDGNYCTSDMGDFSPPDEYAIALDKPGYATSQMRVTGNRKDTALCLDAIACVPGASATCSCGYGGIGSQTCNESGTRYGECERCTFVADAGSD